VPEGALTYNLSRVETILICATLREK